MEGSHYIILLLNLCVLICVGCYSLKEKLKIQVAPLLLISGLLLRVLGSYLGHLKDAVEMVDHLDPELILLSVMPVLIFEAALATEWYTFKRRFVQYVFLGTTVVLVNSLLTALAIKFILWYDYSFEKVWLMGTVLSATDHVAVVAQLKEIKAERRFESLLEGETLVNEAAVLVLFLVLIQGISGDSEGGIGEGIVLFLRKVGGGLAVGFGFCLVVGFLLHRITNDIYREVSLTLASSYLLFFICDGLGVEFSGAISVLGFGLFMSAYGITLVSIVVEEKLHSFWEILGKNTEGVVFVIGGMLLGMQVTEHKHLEVSDLYKLIGLFFLVHVTRGVSILLHYPVLNYSVKKAFAVNLKQLAILTLSGLKGTISITLALIASHHEHLDKRFKSLVLFFALGTSALTISIDTYLVKFLFRKFKLEGLSKVQESMMIGVTSAITQETFEKLESLKNSKEFYSANWAMVNDLVGPMQLLKGVMRKTPSGLQILKEKPKASFEELLALYNSFSDFSTKEVLIEIRRRFYAILKGVYWHEFESGQCLGTTYVLLRDTCNLALDSVNQSMEDWKLLEYEVLNSKWLSVLFALSKLKLVGGFFRRAIFHKIVEAYDAASTFIKCHQEARELITEMKLNSDKEAYSIILEESEEQVKLCKEFVENHIIEAYPEIVSNIHSRQACKILVLSQRKLIEEIFEQGVIEEIEHENLLEAVDKTWKSLKISSTSQLPPLEQLLTNRFTSASEEQIGDLCSATELKTFNAGDLLFEEGQETQNAFLIFRGRVLEKGTWINQKLKIGNIVGVQHLLPEFPVTLTSAKAETIVLAAELSKSALQQTCFLREIYTEASEEILIHYKEVLQLEEAKDEYIYTVVQDSKVTLLQASEFKQVKSGGILLCGNLSNTLISPTLVYPTDEFLEVMEFSVLLEFPTELGKQITPSKTLGLAFCNYCKSKLLQRFTANGSNNFYLDKRTRQFSSALQDIRLIRNSL